MIRWRFIFTRLIILIAIILLFGLGMGPVAKYVTVRGLESMTGAKVDIGQTRVGLLPPRVEYFDVRIADPRDDKEMRNAFEADSIQLSIDGHELAHRRWVAREGRISGLQIGSSRSESGQLDRIDAVESESSGPSFLSRMVSASADKVANQVESAADNLETSKVGKEIIAHWEGEYDRLSNRAKELAELIKTIGEQAKGIENPLRDWPEFEAKLAQVRKARNELVDVHRDLNELPDRVRADAVRLEQARQRDLAMVDKYVPGDLSDSSNFGIDLLSEAVRDQINQVRGYLDDGRTLANYTIVAPESVRVRGADHNLNRVEVPGVMIRHCVIDGVMRNSGDVYAVTGEVDNMTPTPELLAEPTRVRLRMEGPELIVCEYLRDRRDDADVDLLTLHWPDTEAKPLKLGKDSDASIAINGGRRELWVQVRTEGDRVEGMLRSKQTGVQMSINTDERFAESAAGKSLAQSLASVDTIAVDARFEGTWKDLDLKLHTNLGQIFHRAGQDALTGQLRESKAKLAAKVDNAYNQQANLVNDWITSHQREALEVVAKADSNIENMTRKVLDEASDADAMLGRLRGVIRGGLR